VYNTTKYNIKKELQCKKKKRSNSVVQDNTLKAIWRIEKKLNDVCKTK